MEVVAARPRRLASRPGHGGPDGRGEGSLRARDGDRAAVWSRAGQLGRWLRCWSGVRDVDAAGFPRPGRRVSAHPAETDDLTPAIARRRPSGARPRPATLLAACDRASRQPTVPSTRWRSHSRSSVVPTTYASRGPPAASPGSTMRASHTDLPGCSGRAARADLVARGLTCAESGGMRTDGGAAARAAEALSALANRGAALADAGGSGASTPGPVGSAPV